MKKLIVIFIPLLLISILHACKKEVEVMRKLTQEEMIQRVISNQTLPPDILIVDRKGKKIDTATLRRLNNGEMATDLMVDKTGKPIRKIVREKTLEDEIFHSRLSLAYGGWTPVTPIEIPCQSKKQILEGLHQNYFKIKQSEATGKELWNQHQPHEIVVNILEQCGLPTKNEVGEEGINILFLLLRANSLDLTARFYPELKQSVKRGDLHGNILAETEDRFLIMHNKKQIYGTFVRPTGEGDTMEIYPVRDPENLDKRRAGIGMMPIREYVDFLEADCDCQVLIPEELAQVLNQ
ncbi:MAG: hypothetical protein DWQ02_07475 [Bacteroidetes bacterium]|nr:MAG: hypothetical protein DWQ02_07475 [Bacteroidota bacterium]